MAEQQITVRRGSPKLDNIISQLRSVNLSAFATLEYRWDRAIDPPTNSNLEPETVSVEIKVIYTGNNLRPKSFEVKYKIGDDEQITVPLILNY